MAESGGIEGDRVVRLAVLVAAAMLLSGRRYAFPAVNLDPSWGAGLLLGRSNNLQWGNELIFTYGPWGWLAVRTMTTRILLAMSITFTFAVATFLVLVAWKLLRKSFSERASLVLLLFVVVPFYSQVMTTDIFVAGIFGLFALLIDRAARSVHESWKTVIPLTFPVALALQVKVSSGIFALVGLVIVSFLWRRSAKLLGLVFGSLIIWFLALWFLSERSFSGVIIWAQLSFSIAGGFAGALSQSQGQPLPLFLFGLVSIGSIALLVRRSREEHWSLPVAAVATAFVGWSLYAGLKTGFVREGPIRIVDAYGLLIPLWIWLLRSVKFEARRVIVLLIPIVVGIGLLVSERPMVSDLGGLYEWPASVNAWIENSNLLTSRSIFDREAKEAREEAQQAYGISGELLDRLRISGVQIDPFETTLAWAYDVPWKPVPIYQPYQAYTEVLDRANSEALARRDYLQPVLIEANWVETVDGQLSLWTSPRYQMELTCSWEPEMRDRGWELWVRSQNRCGEPESISSSNVSARAAVAIPQASPSEMIVAIFTPESSLTSKVNRAFQFLYKPLKEFSIQLDGVPIPQPRAFNGSPLIVSCPPDHADTNRYSAVCPSPKWISFSEAGTIVFEKIKMEPK